MPVETTPIYKIVSVEPTINNIVKVNPTDTNVIKIDNEITKIISVVEQGPAGPPGIQGPVGPVGTSDWDDLVNKPPLYFTYSFSNQSIVEFDHNMQKYPSVRVIDSGGSEWFGGKIEYLSINRIKIEHSVAITGDIILS